MVQTLERQVGGMMSCTDRMSAGLVEKCDQVQHKLDTILLTKYRVLCAADPQGRQHYTNHFNQFTDDMTTRLTDLNFKILSVAAPST